MRAPGHQEDRLPEVVLAEVGATVTETIIPTNIQPLRRAVAAEGSGARTGDRTEMVDVAATTTETAEEEEGTGTGIETGAGRPFAEAAPRLTGSGSLRREVDGEEEGADRTKTPQILCLTNQKSEALENGPNTRVHQERSTTTTASQKYHSGRNPKNG